MERAPREDGRAPDQLRPVQFTPDFVSYPEGSVLISMGDTRVLCNVTVEQGVPRWLQEAGRAGGWVTAEYALLPRSTQRRTPRETGGLRGRTQEIRRLIGRSLRSAVDLEILGARTCAVDCDVIQADGGTRTAAVTGGYVALAMALKRLIHQGELPPEVLREPVAAVSAGVVDGCSLLDLNYGEDSAAEVDLNVVMNGAGDFIEVQGTAEGAPFPPATLQRLLELSGKGIAELLRAQRKALEAWERSLR